MIDFNQSMQVRHKNEAENVDSSASNRSARSRPFELFIEKLSDYPEPTNSEMQLQPNPAITPFKLFGIGEQGELIKIQVK